MPLLGGGVEAISDECVRGEQSLWNVVVAMASEVNFIVGDRQIERLNTSRFNFTTPLAGDATHPGTRPPINLGILII